MVKNKTGFAVEDSSEPQITEEMINAVPIGDIKYNAITIRDYEASEQPELPVGLFLKAVDDLPAERLITFKIKDDIGKGAYSRKIGKLEENGGQKTKAVINNIASYLSFAVESIGNYTLASLEKRLCKSVSRIFEDMYIADIMTIMIAIRLKARGRNLAVNMECPVNGCEEICKSMTSLDEVKIKYLPDELESKPLFHVEMQHGISDGNDLIKDLYMEPLKFHQIDMFSTPGKVSNVQMLIAMVAKIPGRAGSNPFREEHYDELDATGEDEMALMEAIAKIAPGPSSSVKVACACGRKQINYPLNWARGARDFIYFSHAHMTETEED